jgi:hypothetical protein
MDGTIEDRLAAVERALTDDDHDLSALAADGETADRLQTVEDDLETLRDTVAELEAATQALRGYVGNVRAVNEEVRERADLALETAERAEEAATADTQPLTGADGETTSPSETMAATEPVPGTEDKQPSDSEPMLELTTDDDTQQPPTASSSPTDRCPLCDDGTDTSPRVGQGERTTWSDSQQRGSLAPEDHRGFTDGGVPPSEAESTDDEVALLGKIRALL